MTRYFYAAPFAHLTLDFNSRDELIYVGWQLSTSTVWPALTGVWQEQLDAYFAHKDYAFDAPFVALGTPFQHRVWAAIAQIPHGQVASYGDIARLIDSHARAVGQACGKNPLPIIIPCHRVVAAHGLGGFSLGWRATDLTIKRWLLAHEGAQW